MKSISTKPHCAIYLFVVTLLVFSYGCSKSNSNPTPTNTPTPVTVTSLSEDSAPFNTEIAINGTGFDENFNNYKVFFNGKAATVEEVLDTKIYADVPLAAGTGNITVTVDGKTITGPIFTYQPELIVSTLAGDIYQPGMADGTGVSARFENLYPMTIDKSGNLYAADQSAILIRKITPQGVVTTFAGSSTPGNANGTTATFSAITGLTVDQQGIIFVADNGLIRKITPDGNVTTLQTHLNVGNIIFGGKISAFGITVDAADNLYITDRGNQFVGKVTPDGNITTIVGTQQNQPSAFISPTSLVLDKNGNLFVTDGIIWKITPNNVASKFTTSGGYLNGIATDGLGSFYVTDSADLTVKKITADGTVSVLAGTTESSVIRDGIVTKAVFAFPEGIAIDASGKIFVADVDAIREIWVQ